MADHHVEYGMVARCDQASFLPVAGRQLQALGRWPLTLCLTVQFAWMCLDDSKLLVSVSRDPTAARSVQQYHASLCAVSACLFSRCRHDVAPGCISLHTLLYLMLQQLDAAL